MTILFSVGCYIFYTLFTRQHASYTHATVVAAAATVAVSIVVAAVATEAFDKPSVAFGRWLVARVFTMPPPSPPTTTTAMTMTSDKPEEEEEMLGIDVEGECKECMNDSGGREGGFKPLSFLTETGSSQPPYGFMSANRLA